jgi:hypothetical protein
MGIGHHSGWYPPFLSGTQSPKNRLISEDAYGLCETV